GRVVDPVADHRDAAPLRLEGPDLARLVLGKHHGEHAVQARLARDRLGRQAVVAREHRDAHAEAPEGRDGARRVGLRHVGGGDHAEEPTSEGEVDGRLALGGELPDPPGEEPHVDPASLHQRSVAEEHANTRTATAVVRATRPAGSGPTSPHATNVSAAITSTIGTKTAATRSARRWMGAREPCASATSLMIRARVVSLPTRAARKTKVPVRLTVPAKTLASGDFSTGRLSPVSMD